MSHRFCWRTWLFEVIYQGKHRKRNHFTGIRGQDPAQWLGGYILALHVQGSHKGMSKLLHLPSISFFVAWECSRRNINIYRIVGRLKINSSFFFLWGLMIENKETCICTEIDISWIFFLLKFQVYFILIAFPVWTQVCVKRLHFYVWPIRSFSKI